MLRSKERFLGWRGLLTVLLTAMSLVTAACSEDSPAQPEGPRAELVIHFDPNPALSVRPGEWEYTVTITEVNGVGLYMHEYLTRHYNVAGVQLNELSSDRQTFQKEFLGCGGEGPYIPGGTSRCTSTITTGAMKNTGYAEWEFHGQDDFGNEVIATARVEFF